ncbi:flavodoxin family protein [Shewanella sp. 202IG2-18]|uniref:NAD(P)H-dependent oxidoreductase n=1 Tax=Parashewanella hymeniacidonis TaxID=2807618 RepID=UPI0019610037|nr:flavodoxin family protein [Parashewanella hymeniacidonis]
MKTIIVFGSSNNSGNTASVCERVAQGTDIGIINLNNYNIQPFNYDITQQNDDCLNLFEKLLGYDLILFATPVYWYAPSGQMKVFIDRFSDLLHLHKPLGRQLRTKSAAVIATGADDIPQTCFEDMFKNTFNYLGMKYLGLLYVSFGKDDQPETSQRNKIAHFKTMLAIDESN